MSNKQEAKQILSTPEKEKINYVQQWLEKNIKTDLSVKLSTDQKTPPSSPTVIKSEFLSPAYPNSPILCGKRPATSPIIGGTRKILKQSKFKRKKAIKNLETKLSLSNEFSKDAEPNILPIEDFDLSADVTEISEFNESTKSSKFQKSPKKIFQSKKSFTNLSEILNDTTPILSQLIESVSSDNKSVANSEITVQDIKSDTSKTISDLIEEINCSQLVEDDTTFCVKIPVPLSQNISDPTSNSSEDIDNVDDSSKINLSEVNINQEFIDSSIQIDSISTSESKVDLSKTSYIIQCSTQKKKKIPKKGSLLDLLITNVAKEKSSVNLLRHQVHKKTANIVEKPFILLKILEYLPVINEKQFLKCALIDDSANLLGSFIHKNTNKYITVINSPEISSIINTDYKPVLKIYEPWTILDNDQLVMHITRFIAIPETETKICDTLNESVNSEFQVLYENHCSCIDEKILLQNCPKKIHKNINNKLIKKIMDYS